MTRRYRMTRRRVAAKPDILTRYWNGDPPPDEAPDAGDRELILDATFFAAADGTKPAHVQWSHHPHQGAWLDWLRSS